MPPGNTVIGCLSSKIELLLCSADWERTGEEGGSKVREKDVERGRDVIGGGGRKERREN